MGLFADIDGDMFPPDEPTPEEAAILAQEYWHYVEVTEEAPWECDRFEARPIDMQKKRILANEKCARVAHRLRFSRHWQS